MVGASGFDSAETLEQKAEIAGAIGEGMAIKFIEHRRIASKLPISEVIDGKIKS